MPVAGGDSCADNDAGGPPHEERGSHDGSAGEEVGGVFLAVASVAIFFFLHVIKYASFEFVRSSGRYSTVQASFCNNNSRGVISCVSK